MEDIVNFRLDTGIMLEGMAWSINNYTYFFWFTLVWIVIYVAMNKKNNYIKSLEEDAIKWRDYFESLDSETLAKLENGTLTKTTYNKLIINQPKYPNDWGHEPIGIMRARKESESYNLYNDEIKSRMRFKDETPLFLTITGILFAVLIIIAPVAAFIEAVVVKLWLS